MAKVRKPAAPVELELESVEDEFDLETAPAVAPELPTAPELLPPEVPEVPVVAPLPVAVVPGPVPKTEGKPAVKPEPPVKRPPRGDPNAGHATSNEAVAGSSSAARPEVAESLTHQRPQAQLDDRKLSKGQKSKLENWNNDKRGAMLDDYMAGVTEVARTEFGNSNVLVADEKSALLVGIPCPALAFEYVIAQDVFPLGLIMHLVGKSGTNKSSLLDEFFRWFVRARGLGNLFEVESKRSPDLLPSIVGYDVAPKFIRIDNCNSVEDWQKHLQFWLWHHKQRLVGTKEKPGPGRTVPILFGVDSIMGKLSWESQEKVREKGFGGRSWPVEAGSITQFMKTVPQDIVGWPFTIVLNNHLKLGQDDNGHEVRRTGGGAGVNFQESFELEMRMRKSNIENNDLAEGWRGRVLAIRCQKNSFGDTYREIDTRFLWWEELDEAATATAGHEVWRQKSLWDWNWATVHLLINLKGRAAGRVEKILHIAAPHVSDVENDAYSETLGMKKEDAVPWSKLGAMIAAQPDLMHALRDALCIKRRPLLAGDYLKQLDALAQQLP